MSSLGEEQKEKEGSHDSVRRPRRSDGTSVRGSGRGERKARSAAESASCEKAGGLDGDDGGQSRVGSAPTITRLTTPKHHKWELRRRGWYGGSRTAEAAGADAHEGVGRGEGETGRRWTGEDERKTKGKERLGKERGSGKGTQVSAVVTDIAGCVRACALPSADTPVPVLRKERERNKTPDTQARRCITPARL